MAGQTHGDTADLLASGWAHLHAAEWEAARGAFSEALAHRETPEALEGLGWAAWWLDDAETVFPARERAFRLYRSCDDPASAARVGIWIASDHLDFRGAVAVSSGWLRRARRLLVAMDTRPEHGWLTFHEGYLAALAGDVVVARQRAAQTAEVGRHLDAPDLEMLGLALDGSLLVSRGEIDEGMRRLDEAGAMAGEATIPISSGWAWCFLITACTTVLDLDRAAAWCVRTAELADRFGSRYLRAFCRAEYGAVHVWRGRWSDAEELLESSIEDFSRSRPAMVGGALVELAELRRRQGRLDEVARLLERAGATGPALLCRARVEFDRGRPLHSAELVERVLRQSPPESKVDRAPALEHLVRSRVASGELDRAVAALGELWEVEKLVATEPVHALAEVCDALVAAAGGDHESARSSLESAVDRFTRCGTPFEAARARLELTTSLIALGQLDLAAQEAGAAATSLDRLGAEVESGRAHRLLDVATNPAGLAVTRRERDVLVLLAEGLTNRQIAAQLVVSEHTVHRHVTNILRKLDLPSRTAAAAYVVRSGLTAGRHG
ncbi:helix-turn-helix transcriptional regulator [Actinomycetospora cinnamomea]|uniref:Regulatory LuxR family protein n=1 Tax=Actinomycetospora cinnamomea TaxID=663609 RepID=A0A2U1F010_9PSEU|nr:helix-turn-helix transcriptional regulator [Actinomycetospora cinnamomea]PVZ05340.1 regulatory LuxR family protein [Actinomycetospora cinnamomea]